MEQRNIMAVQVSLETFQAITAYLGSRPYREVAGIMGMLQINRAIYDEPDTIDASNEFTPEEPETPKSAGET